MHVKVNTAVALTPLGLAKEGGMQAPRSCRLSEKV